MGKQDRWLAAAHLRSTEEIDHWRGKTGQRTGTAFDLTTLFLAILSLVTTANHQEKQWKTAAISNYYFSFYDQQ